LKSQTCPKLVLVGIITIVIVVTTTSNGFVNTAFSKPALLHHHSSPLSINFGHSSSRTHLLLTSSTGAAFNNTDKIVIITFGDTKKSQFTTAKPILDRYGFKASFFITCNYANEGDRNPRYHMSWNDILALQSDGQDIESKGMNPVDLNNLSPAALNFEVGNSKVCLQDHGIISPNNNIFAAKYGDVWNNLDVINVISKY
jgi:peptidoglycan/xylan/chitin deacetylase (PgdA/CDA1 family)